MSPLFKRAEGHNSCKPEEKCNREAMLISAVVLKVCCSSSSWVGEKNLLFTISVQSSVEAAHANVSKGENVLVPSVKIWKHSNTTQKIGGEDFA